MNAHPFVEPGTGRVTLSAVAQLAGTSPGSASLAINGDWTGRISATTCARVRAAALQLGYWRGCDRGRIHFSSPPIDAGSNITPIIPIGAPLGLFRRRRR